MVRPDRKRGLQIQTQDHLHQIPQINGVRQRSPESPTLQPTQNASEMADRNRVPDSGPPPPMNGAGFQDDMYIWAHYRPFLQKLLDKLQHSLKQRRLDIHAGKTRYVHSEEGKQTSRVGGSTSPC